MILHGRVWKYGDDVNTDVIFPGKYTYTVTEPKEQAKHALEDLDPTFAGNVQPGDWVGGLQISDRAWQQCGDHSILACTRVAA